MVGVSKDVQDQLLQSRSRKRTSGEVPYPVQFSQKQLACDNWNQMFLSTLCRNVTMHQFETPPSTVLDLGCGSGLWVLEAAKIWKSSRFIGFDLLKLQPDLTRAALQYPDANKLVDRVKWVHGDFLERLPFPPNYFDFVRMCSLGLAIPEDEWHDVIQEVTRVLRPGGVLEIIEEDLVFPCGRAPIADNLSEASQLSIPLSTTHSTLSGSTTPSVHSAASGRKTRASPRSQHTAPPVVSRYRPFLKNTYSLDSSHNRNSLRSVMSPPSLPDFTSLLNPQDHTRLKAAWLEMLHRRFLSPKLISVLPFYLSSSELKDIKTLPTLHVPLPPNSDAINNPLSSHWFDNDLEERDPNFVLDLRSQSVRPSSESRKAETASISSRHSRSTFSSAWASMHLARTVDLIEGCKHTIFAEFKRMESPHTQDKDADGSIARAEFESAWANWLNDMKDRMGLRNRLQQSLSWSIPVDSERPDWRVWRDRVGSVDSDTASTSPETQDNEVCRSLRGFVAWKA